MSTDNSNAKDERIRELEERTQYLTSLTYNIVDVLGTVVEFRNMEFGLHVRRVRAFTRILGTNYMKLVNGSGLTPEIVSEISYAAVLHDIGKIVIPESIVLKPGKLTREEFDVMKTHTTKGAEIMQIILNNMTPDPYMKYCYDIVKYHHEKYDGKGYPDGLKGDDIPLCAQLVSIADCYDALISERVYKAAYSKEDAFNMICGGECGIFNPKLMNCFVLSRKELEIEADRQERPENSMMNLL